VSPRGVEEGRSNPNAIDADDDKIEVK